MRNFFKNFAYVVIFILAVAAIFAFTSPKTETPKQVSLSQLVADINSANVKSVAVTDSSLEITYNDNTKATAEKETDSSLSQTLVNLGANKDALAKISFESKIDTSIWSSLIPLLLSSILPLAVFAIILMLIFRQAKGNAMQAFDFTKAKTRILGGNPKEKTTFADVAGLKEAKEELQEIIDFLKNPDKYLKMGAKIPRGVLLMGLPGTGKTLLAKAIANEGNVPFFSISGSEFIELFVGVGASRVRSLFEQAHKVGRAIIFIDEIDSIGKVRGVGLTGGHEEREQTLNQILAEMDGIESGEGIIVLGATNRPEYLDPALLRPGRFDRRIVLDLPDSNDREAILKIHCRQKPLANDINLREVAERTPGFSGADIANVVNEAALLAAKRNKTEINQTELLESIEKVMLGPEKKSHLLSKDEKKIAAYHESGHALVSSSLPGTEPVRKISIISRGMAAGYTLKTPTEEKKLRTKDDFISEIATLLGGMTAENLIFGKTSTGASNDLKQASKIARKMVKEYGMSPLGPIVFGEKEELAFLGQEFEGQRNYSEAVAAKIDDEIAKIIKSGQDSATQILTQKKDTLEKIALRLIEKETIEKEEYEQLVGISAVK
ncbi:MAG: ATP-dependent zinc metalloprotease FtsH [Candidatus Pacebacteria bacterium]|jgi:cell division protease FtsH|nr:ATP-dependent zinc metalloprotease FtsH [Candidatus Paceibacterota bacterium]